MKKKPSRTLNEQTQVLGLNGSDFAGLGLTYMIAQRIFAPEGLEILSLLTLVISALFLISIRLRYRRKIIRDFLGFCLNQFLFLGRRRGQ